MFSMLNCILNEFPSLISTGRHGNVPAAQMGVNNGLAFFNLPSCLSLLRARSPWTLQMNMMANAVPYGGPYGQPPGQGPPGAGLGPGLPGAGLGPGLHNKAGMSNSLAAQFSMDKKPLPGQGMSGMVRETLSLSPSDR